MQKRHYILLVISLVVVIAIIALKDTLMGGSGGPVSFDINNTDKLPKIDWNMLYRYDFETKKGPDELLKLDGKAVRIAGYIVPLTDNYAILDQFLMVPDAQACIHVPPPPPNLIIQVKLKKPLPISEVSNPAWVSGIFKIETTSSQHGSAAYTLDARKMEKFTY